MKLVPRRGSATRTFGIKQVDRDQISTEEITKLTFRAFALRQSE